MNGTWSSPALDTHPSVGCNTASFKLDFMRVDVWPACVSVCYVQAWCPEGQKRVSDALGLGLQCIVVNTCYEYIAMYMLQIKSESPRRAATALHPGTSVQPQTTRYQTSAGNSDRTHQHESAHSLPSSSLIIKTPSAQISVLLMEQDCRFEACLGDKNEFKAGLGSFEGLFLKIKAEKMGW